MDASKWDSGKWTDTRCLLSIFPGLFRLVVAYLFHIPKLAKGLEVLPPQWLNSYKTEQGLKDSSGLLADDKMHTYL